MALSSAKVASLLPALVSLEGSVASIKKSVFSYRPTHEWFWFLYIGWATQSYTLEAGVVH